MAVVHFLSEFQKPDYYGMLRPSLEGTDSFGSSSSQICKGKCRTQPENSLHALKVLTGGSRLLTNTTRSYSAAGIRPSDCGPVRATPLFFLGQPGFGKFVDDVRRSLLYRLCLGFRCICFRMFCRGHAFCSYVEVMNYRLRICLVDKLFNCALIFMGC
jgi:hypothetical protein